MANSRARIFLERLIRDEYSAGDMFALFSYVRDHCDNRRVVKEIGAFVAHQHEREKGIVNEAARAWFTTVRFHMPNFMEGGQERLRAGIYPEATRDYVQNAVKIFGEVYIRKNTGLSYKKAELLSKQLASRFQQNQNSTWSLPIDITPDEAKFLNCIFGILHVSTAFDPTLLWSEFSLTLRSQGLISKEELKEHGPRLSALVQIFTVSIMHNNNIVMENGDKIRLVASANQSTKNISVLAPVSGLYPNYTAKYACAMIEVALDPKDYCDEELLNYPDIWDFDVELSKNGRLSVLR